MSWTGFDILMYHASSTKQVVWRKRNHRVWHCHFTRLSLFLGWGFLVLGGKLKNQQKRWRCVILACSSLIKEPQSYLRRPFIAVTKTRSVCRSLPCGCCEGFLQVTTFVVWTPDAHGAIWADGLSLSSEELTDGWLFQPVLAWTTHKQ